MDWQLTSLLLVVLLFSFLLAGVWIAVGLGMVGILGLLVIDPSTIRGVGVITWDTLNSFVLTAVPLFLFMGTIILHSGISARFYKGLSTWLDHVPGSLAHSNVLACSIFAAISGSSVATAAAIGSIAIPEMESRGYSRSLTYGSLAAGGTLGILIPPSIVFILYGAIIGESVGRLFIAGVIPGVLTSALFALYIGVRTIIDPLLVPRGEIHATWGERLRGLIDVLPIFMLMFMVLGGIYFGLTTPTEAAAVGVAGALLIAIIYRRLNWTVLKESLHDAIKANSMILFIVVGAQIMSYALVTAGIPRAMVALITSFQVKPMVIFTFLCLMYLVLGCFMDAISLMLLTLPVVFPVMMALGYDPVWFGVVLVLLLEIGLITPPVGMNLFVIQGIARQPLGIVAWGAFPFVILMLIMVVMLALYPQLALWLPAKMM
ncbi:MAG: TRAP transporter large permease [Deltaproteobacteria bacterium]|nr:TRAP transporter large permease [Deltaproteobacteria bacterium]MBW2306886.1 TRAP transporter large permease [Deltaproteobacteria bacterium]